MAAVGNLFDSFFEGGRDHALAPGTCSATHLPYFEGDYWPGEAENVLAAMPPFGDGSGNGRGGLSASSSSSALARPKPAISSSRAKGPKGSKRGAGLSGPGSTASPDERLMARLGDVVGGMRDDFIVVHLRRPCSHCRRYPSAPERMWVFPAPETEEEKEQRRKELELERERRSSQRSRGTRRQQQLLPLQPLLLLLRLRPPPRPLELPRRRRRWP